MKTENIIEGLNRHIEIRRKELGIDTSGHLILTKKITTNTSFKAYKTYEYTLWYRDFKDKYRIITISKTDRVIGNEEDILKELDIDLCIAIFNWIGTDFYNKIMKGEYDGNEIE